MRTQPLLFRVALLQVESLSVLTTLQSVEVCLPPRELSRAVAAPRECRRSLTRLPRFASRRWRFVRLGSSQPLVIVVFVEMCLLLVVRQFSAL